MMITKSEYEKGFNFLDTLRELGVANMFGSRKYIQEAFNFDAEKAGEIASKWMETFDDKTSVEDRVKTAMGADYFVDNSGFAVPNEAVSFKE